MEKDIIPCRGVDLFSGDVNYGFAMYWDLGQVKLLASFYYFEDFL